MAIQITKTAVAEIKRMQAVRKQPESKLRLGLSPGGCERWHYTLDLVDTLSEDEELQEISGLKIAIKSEYLPYLSEIKLDYSEDLMGGAFRFQNPQAATVCGCGNSFSTAQV
jgi:iron-sulfur cluster assembly accessory protein